MTDWEDEIARAEVLKAVAAKRNEAAEPADAAEDRDVGGGLACPDCGCRDFAVVYTRHDVRHNRIRRRRACRHCGRRVFTTEKIIED